MTYHAKRETYKGHPILAIYAEGESKPLVSFGARKGRAILAVSNDIVTFVAESDKVTKPETVNA